MFDIEKDFNEISIEIENDLEATRLSLEGSLKRMQKDLADPTPQVVGAGAILYATRVLLSGLKNRVFALERRLDEGFDQKRSQTAYVHSGSGPLV